MSCDTWGKEYGEDEAWYDVSGPAIFAGDDDRLRLALASVLVRLPKRVRHFVQRRCQILSIGGLGVWGITWPASIVDKRKVKWLIVMSETAYRSQGRRESAIAHEVAHAWLGHNRLDPDISPDVEEEADNQAVAWGFSRSYSPAQLAVLTRRP